MDSTRLWKRSFGILVIVDMKFLQIFQVQFHTAKSSVLPQPKCVLLDSVNNSELTVMLMKPV